MKIWLYPGTFDPVTLGHEGIAKRALTLCDRLIIAVMENPAKHKLFSLQERLNMLRIAFRGQERVEIVSSQGLTVQLYAQCGACAVVRGIRSPADAQYELAFNGANRMLMPTMESVLLCADTQYLYTSSENVRELIKFGGEYGIMLNKEVEEYAAKVLQAHNEHPKGDAK